MGTDDDEVRRANARSDFWMKVGGITFGLWALAVPFAAMLIKESITESAKSQQAFQKQFQDYIVAMERRVTILESNQQMVLRRLADIDAERQRSGYGGEPRR